MSEDRPVSSTRGFRVHFYEQEGALIAECHGRLIYENAPHLKDEVRAKIPGNKHIILDLLDVPQVDSSGLGMLERLARKVAVRLVVPDGAIVARTLHVTGLDQLVPTFGTREEAVNG